MASYTCTNGDTWVRFRVTGLSAGQTVRFFIRLSSETSGILDENYTATGNTMIQLFDVLEPDTKYTVNVGVDTGSGNNWIGPKAFTTDSGVSANRPDNWNWWSAVASGKDVALSAAEWTAFCTRVNEFRAYKGLSSASFNAVSSGTPIRARVVNQVRNAIADMNSNVPLEVSPGDELAASFFTGLRDALNGIV